MERYTKKSLKDFNPSYTCRFHPTDSFHEVGCPHRAWGIDDLQKALNAAKQSNAYLSYIAFGTGEVYNTQTGELLSD